MPLDSAASGNPSPGAGGPPSGSPGPPAAPGPPGSPGPGGSPLDESQFALVQEAARAYKPLKRAAYIALGSAITTLVIGTSAVAFTLFWPSFASVLVTVGVCAVGAVEFAGYQKMRRADPSAARWLGRNQLAFLGLIALYCAIQMLTFSAEEIKAAALSPEFRAQLGAMPDMERDINSIIEQWGPLVTYGFYSLVIVLSVLFQGGLALYYFTRQKFLDAFQRGTPPWVRRLLIECGPDAAR